MSTFVVALAERTALCVFQLQQTILVNKLEENNISLVREKN